MENSNFRLTLNIFSEQYLPFPALQSIRKLIEYFYLHHPQLISQRLEKNIPETVTIKVFLELIDKTISTI